MCNFNEHRTFYGSSVAIHNPNDLFSSGSFHDQPLGFAPELIPHEFCLGEEDLASESTSEITFSFTSTVSTYKDKSHFVTQNQNVAKMNNLRNHFLVSQLTFASDRKAILSYE